MHWGRAATCACGSERWKGWMGSCWFMLMRESSAALAAPDTVLWREACECRMQHQIVIQAEPLQYLMQYTLPERHVKAYILMST